MHINFLQVILTQMTKNILKRNVKLHTKIINHFTNRQYGNISLYVKTH